MEFHTSGNADPSSLFVQAKVIANDGEKFITGRNKANQEVKIDEDL